MPQILICLAYSGGSKTSKILICNILIENWVKPLQKKVDFLGFRVRYFFEKTSKI